MIYSRYEVGPFDVIGSGSFTHDLSELRGHDPNDPAPDWVNKFADWLWRHDSRRYIFLHARRGIVLMGTLMGTLWERAPGTDTQLLNFHE